MKVFFKGMLAFVLILVLFVCAVPVYAAGEGALVGNDGLVLETGSASDFPIVAGGQAAKIWIDANESAPVQRVIGDFQADVERVTGIKPTLSKDTVPPSGTVVLIGTLDGSAAIKNLLTADEVQSIEGKWEAYLIKVVDANTLVVVGSDPRGAIFGTYEISEQMGVSPWYYFADAKIQTKSEVYVPAGTLVTDLPDVQYRGIFINDEEKLSRWVTNVMGDNNVMGTKAYSHIFELMLRLKGNYIWPAMHVNSFNNVADNIPLAQEYGIVVGSSHCDMLLRTNVHEWSNWANANKGNYGGSVSYDYTVSKQAVLDYWRENVVRHKDTEAQWTLGMRGAHDEPFNTANINKKNASGGYLYPGADEAERKALLMNEIIKDQQQILKEVLGDKKYDRSFQAFIPYKEVLPIYNHASFELPENVTVIWCDDNHSIMRRLPDAQERQRAGGHGIYYHVSYWAPADQSYLWLSSAPLSLIGEELNKSYESGIEKAWVLNVGDIKPQEIEMTFFIRSGWDVDAYKNNTDQFLEDWMESQFGSGNGAEIADLLTTFYQQGMVRKLEHMKTGIFDQTYFGDEGAKRVAVYQDLFDRAEIVYDSLLESQKLGFYELVQCKINWGYYVNKAYYYADRSNLAYDQGRMASADAFLALSQEADQGKKDEIALYSTMNHGKWKLFIDPEKHTPPVINQLPAGNPAMVLGASGMGAIVQGERLPQENSVLTFSPYGQDGKFVDVFNTGAGSFDWTATTNASWVTLTETAGTVYDEVRLWVNISGIESQKGETATITITNTNSGTTKTVEVKVENPDKALASIDGYAEADGYLSIEAEHYSRLNPSGSITWQTIKDLGRATGGDVMRAHNPALEPVENTANAPSLEYDITLTSSGEFPLEIYRIPTLNAKGKVRFAVSVDGGDPIVVESVAADEGQGTIWVSNLFHTIEKHVVVLPHLSAGEHTMKLWMVDNFIMIDKMVLYTGEEGVIPTEIGPEESYHSQYNTAFTAQVPMLDRTSTAAVPKDLPATWGDGPFLEEGGKVAIEAEYAMENSLSARSELTAAMGAYTLSNWDLAAEVAGKIPNAWRLTQSDTGMAMRLPDLGAIWTEKAQFEKYSPELGYQVKFATPGTYNVWCRWRFVDDASDSIRGGIGGVYGGTFSTGAFFNYNLDEQWHWAKVGTVKVNAAGEQVFSLWMREDGLHIDRIYLSTGTENPPENNVWLPSLRSYGAVVEQVKRAVEAKRTEMAANSYPLGTELGCYSQQAYDQLLDVLTKAEALAQNSDLTQEQANEALAAITKADEDLVSSLNLVDNGGRSYNAYRDFEEDELAKFPYGIVAESLTDGATALIMEEGSNKFFRVTTPSVSGKVNMFLPYMDKVATGANGQIVVEYRTRFNGLFRYGNAAMLRNDTAGNKYAMVVAFDNGGNLGSPEYNIKVQNGGSNKQTVQKFVSDQWYAVKMVGNWNASTYSVYIDNILVATDFNFRDKTGSRLTGHFFGVDNFPNGSMDFDDFKVNLVAAEGIETISGSVTIDGTVKQGEVLTANVSALTPTESTADLSYSWKRGTTEVGTSSTYRPSKADAGSSLTVTVTYTGTIYFGSMTSDKTVPVALNADTEALKQKVDDKLAQLAGKSIPIADELGCYSPTAYDTLMNALDLAETASSDDDLTQGEAELVWQTVIDAETDFFATLKLTESGKTYNAYRDFENDENSKEPYGFATFANQNATSKFQILEESDNKFLRLTTPNGSGPRMNLELPIAGDLVGKGEGEIIVFEYRARFTSGQYANQLMPAYDNKSYAVHIGFENSSSAKKIKVQDGTSASNKKNVADFTYGTWYDFRVEIDRTAGKHKVYMDEALIADFALRSNTGTNLVSWFFGIDGFSNGQVDYDDFKVSLVGGTSTETLSGTLSISGSPEFGETLSADIGSVLPAEAQNSLSYSWERETTEIGSADTYTLTAADIGQVINLTATGTGNYMGSLTAQTAQVEKASQPIPLGFSGERPTSTGGSDGKITGLKSSMDYEYDDGQNSWILVSGTTEITGLEAGDYFVRLAETTTHKQSLAILVEILDYDAPEPAPTPTAAEFDTATLRLSGVDDTMEYSVNGGASWRMVDGTTADLSAAGLRPGDTILVRVAEDLPNHSASQSKIINLTQAPAPTKLSGRAPTSKDGSDGVILGMSSSRGYQYEDSQEIWVALTESTTFKAGSYQVRVAAEGSIFASQEVTVVVPDYLPGTVGVAVTGVTLDKTTGQLYSNQGSLTLLLSAQIEPADAFNKSVTWASSDERVATVDPAGVVTAVGNGEAVITVTTTDGGYTASCTLTVSTYSSGGNTGSTGSSGGSGGSGSSNRDSSVGTTTATAKSETDTPVTTTITVAGKVDDKGSLSVVVTDQKVKEAIEKAQAEAKRTGKTNDGIVVEIVIPTTGGKSLTATIDGAALTRLNAAGAELRVSSTLSQISLDAEALKVVKGQSPGGITFAATPVTQLSDETKALIGSRPIFNLTISYQKNGKTETLSAFGKGTVKLGIPYNVAPGEKTGNLFVVHVDSSGKPQLVTNSSYHNGWMIWSGNSLSTYGVGYKTPVQAFTDTETHWAADNIDFITSRNLLSSTGSVFVPNGAITRADVVVALGKLSGVDVSSYKVSSFSDVQDTDPAMPYIEWAVARKIIQGTSSTKFAPTATITREQLSVMLVNYGKAIGYTLPASRLPITFVDNAKISSTAKTAVKTMQQSGVMVGKSGNLFDPQAAVTRAEASTTLRRYMELTMSEDTARGWVENDSGQRQYVSTQGKVVTGWLTTVENKYYFDSHGAMATGKWQEIKGKWYYFSAGGQLARSTTIDGYKVGADGARAAK